jgi:PadR family transcriptional regulator, regulatory protein PadR
VRRDEIPPGALEMLILTSLSRHREMHGFEIVEAIERRSGDVLSVPEGSLYPALQRMLLRRWVVAEWGTTEGNRRARYYRVTAGGRKHLEDQVLTFERIFSAIHRVVTTI